MKVVRANKIDRQKLTIFFNSADELQQKNILKSGYVIEYEHTIIGCFILKRMADESLWLKQLYIDQRAARLIPLLFEMILKLANEKNAKKVYLFSHQPMIDIILETLQFHKTTRQIFPKKSAETVKGKWWYYKLA